MREKDEVWIWRKKDEVGYEENKSLVRKRWIRFYIKCTR